MDADALLNRYVVAAFLLQPLSYAALTGLVEHGQVTPLVELVRRLPTPVAAVLGVLAVPALLVAIAVGVAVEVVSEASLHDLGIGLVSGDDLPFLLVAYLLSVGVARIVVRSRRRGE